MNIGNYVTAFVQVDYSNTPAGLLSFTNFGSAASGGSDVAQNLNYRVGADLYVNGGDLYLSDTTAPSLNFRTGTTTKGIFKYLHASNTLQAYVGGTAAANIAFQFAGAGFTIGGGAAGVDYSLSFNGETNDGTLTWMEDEDYFKFSDDILLATSEAIYFRDSAISIKSNSDGYLDLDADVGINLNGNIILDPTDTNKFTGSTYTKTAAFGYGSTSPYTIYSAVDGEVVVDIYVVINQAWNGSSLFTIGDASDPDGFATDANITQATPGIYCYHTAERGAYLWNAVYNAPVRKFYTASTDIIATITPASATTGIATVYLVIQKLK
jgi:hypothetical protein